MSCRGSIQLLCYCPRKGNYHEHICKLLIHYDANNSLELPDSYTAVSTSGARRQHGGPRSKRGAVVGRAKLNRPTFEMMWSLQAVEKICTSFNIKNSTFWPQFMYDPKTIICLNSINRLSME